MNRTEGEGRNLSGCNALRVAVLDSTRSCHTRSFGLAWLAAATFGALACSGNIKLPAGIGETGAGTGTVQVDGPAVAAVVELRRITRSEMNSTLQMLVGDSSGLAMEIMPGTEAEVFETDYTVQEASTLWVEAAESVANKVVAATLASPERKKALLPCTPTGNADTACLAKFVRSFGRKVLHRPLKDDEVAEFASLHSLALQRGDFTTSMGLVMRRMLLDPEFLFRVELGMPVEGGAKKLTAFELAARMSFLLLGRAPDSALLDQVESGALATSGGVRDVARTMLNSAEGKRQVEAFHGAWLGYESLPSDSLFTQNAVAETNALINRVIFEQRSDYRNIYTATETYIDDTMASHYGLKPTGSSGKHWVSYAGSGRQGVLSHATVLSNGMKGDDTSPTMRGKWIRERLFCQTIKPPPPNVVADVPPAGTNNSVCKVDRYAVHATGGCANCHAAMDPVGFGLERYDGMGKFRLAEAEHQECAISGDGEVRDVGTFNGPKGLADLMVKADIIDGCVVRQMFRFGTGRKELVADEPFLRDMTQAFVASGRKFDEMVLDYVSHPTFAEVREASL